MNWQIVVRISNNDSYLPPREPTNETLTVINFDRDAANRTVGNNIDNLLEQNNLTPPLLARDFLNISIAIYSADKMVQRNEAYDGWTRYFTLYIPVTNKSVWDNEKELLLETVRFLTGDHWEIKFRDHTSNVYSGGSQPDLIKKNKTEGVSLLSGGLDSFAGAISLLEDQFKELLFVSHYGSGSITKPIQDDVITYLQQEHGSKVTPIQAYVQPPQPLGDNSEYSQRSRSILFIALGIIISASVGKGIPLYIFENGFISLNNPLSNNRVGSLSTRTTHPYFLSNIQILLNNLGLDIPLETPFQFLTKGEMLKDVTNQTLLGNGIRLTRSCSKSNLRYKGYSPKGHCGYCLPCIVRRAAIRKAKLPEGEYMIDVLSEVLPPSIPEGEDLRDIKLALFRLEDRSTPAFLDLAANGPLPHVHAYILNYEDLYQRGMREIKDFLGF